MNCEIYGLGLARRTTTLAALANLNDVRDLAAEREIEGAITNTPDATWYCYDDERWGPWVTMNNSDGYFPLTGTLRTQYDYIGADVAVRIESQAGRLTPGANGATVTNVITWSAAAKPFGYLEGDERPNAYGLVLPAFHDVRLFPVDASTAPSGGAFNLEWRQHIELHLADYLQRGPLNNGCWYCQQLVTWENDEFRQQGVEWLRDNSAQCDVTGGPGGGRGGGSRRGH